MGTDEGLFDGLKLADDGVVEGITDALIDGLGVDGNEVGIDDRVIVGLDVDGDLVSRDEGLLDDVIVGFDDDLIDGLADDGVVDGIIDALIDGLGVDGDEVGIEEDGRAVDDVVVGTLEGLLDGREVDEFTVGMADTDVVRVEGAAVILVLLTVGFTVPAMLGPLLDAALTWQGRWHTLSDPQMAEGLQHPFIAHPQLFTVVQLPVDDEYAAGSEAMENKNYDVSSVIATRYIRSFVRFTYLRTETSSCRHCTASQRSNHYLIDIPQSTTYTCKIHPRQCEGFLLKYNFIILLIISICIIKVNRNLLARCFSLMKSQQIE